MMFIAADPSGCLPPRASYPLRVKLYLLRSVLAIGSWVMLVTANALFPESSLAGSPTVAITSPTASTTLTGTIVVTVSVTDTGTGVAGAQLQVDGHSFRSRLQHQSAHLFVGHYAVCEWCQLDRSAG